MQPTLILASLCIWLPLTLGCSGTPTPSPSPSPPTATPSVTATPRPTVTPTSVPPVVYSYRIVNTYPHDPDAFTQGLVVQNGVLYEGTGLRGGSSLRRVDMVSGNVLKSRELPDTYFGEGITVWRDRIVQLTWQSRVGFVYDRDTFDLLSQFSYSTEGWGITHDGKHLIMSDGSATLRFLDPDSLTVVGQIAVTDGSIPVTRLNELEYIDGEIYANIWQTDWIARIDPVAGRVVGWIDLSGILRPEDRKERVDVLNGIAYDADERRLFVTGKWWPKLFEIVLTPR